MNIESITRAAHPRRPGAPPGAVLIALAASAHTGAFTTQSMGITPQRKAHE